MPVFSYRARDESGRPVKGILEAESSRVLAERLRKMGYLVTRIEEATSAFGKLKPLSFVYRLPQETLVLTSFQLANLVAAGIPLVSSLKTISSQVAYPHFKEALETVIHQIESGASFSQALSQHPRLFPKLMVGLVQVGEASGHLDAVLARFANLLEKDLSLHREVKGALLYPTLLLVAATALILFMVTFVVPQFAGVFAKAKIPLPIPTQILQFVGEGIRAYGWAFALCGTGGLALSAFALQDPRVRDRVDRALLKLPMVGGILHQTLISHFSRTFATLVGSGVPILSGLEIAEEVAGNVVLTQEIQRLRTAVERGERIATTLSAGRFFSPDAIQMIRVGEESGRLESMLEKVADFYELKVNFSLKKMTTLLEPILLIFIGSVVALIMASLLLPMFDMVRVLQRGGIR